MKLYVLLVVILLIQSYAEVVNGEGRGRGKEKEKEKRKEKGNDKRRGEDDESGEIRNSGEKTGQGKVINPGDDRQVGAVDYNGDQIEEENGNINSDVNQPVPIQSKSLPKTRKVQTRIKSKNQQVQSPFRDLESDKENAPNKGGERGSGKAKGSRVRGSKFRGRPVQAQGRGRWRGKGRGEDEQGQDGGDARAQPTRQRKVPTKVTVAPPREGKPAPIMLPATSRACARLLKSRNTQKYNQRCLPATDTLPEPVPIPQVEPAAPQNPEPVYDPPPVPQPEVVPEAVVPQQTGPESQPGQGPLREGGDTLSEPAPEPQYVVLPPEAPQDMLPLDPVA